MKGSHVLPVVLASPLLVFPLLLGGGTTSAAQGLTGVPSEYVDVLLRAGAICADVSPSILAAQVAQESTWDPNATSPVGAQGIAQFMPGTWAAHGLDGDGDGKADVLNPIDAIWSQGTYMCDLASTVTAWLDQGKVSGSVLDLTLAAYNAGLGNVETYHGIPPFTETQNYVATITTNAKTYVATGSAGTTATGNAIVARAQTYFGVPYVWGGSSPTGVDCSGLVHLVYHDLGHDLPVRTADQMANYGTPVSRADMQPGDLIAFRYKGATTYHHIGIYAGTDAGGVPQMIHAPDVGGFVEQVSLSTTYWQSMDWRIVRF